MAIAIHSGKFCIHIQIAKSTAPEIVASGIPAATPQNNTQMANHSGILWRVMASAIKVVLCQLVLIHSVSLDGKFIWRWGITLSNQKRKATQSDNQKTTGNTCMNQDQGLMSRAGMIKLQTLAATITPPVKPRSVSIVFFFISLKKNTIDAHRAVTHHVNNVAKKAQSIGSIPAKNEIMFSINIFLKK